MIFAPKTSRIDWPSVELLFFSSDLTLRELSAKTGLSFGTISSRAARNGWQVKKDQLKAGTLPPSMRPMKPPASPIEEMQARGPFVASGDESNDASGESLLAGIAGNQGDKMQSCEQGGDKSLQAHASKGAKGVSARDMVENAMLSLATEGVSYRDRMARQARRLPGIMEGMNDKDLLQASDKLERLDKMNRRTLELDTAKDKQPLIQIDVLASLSVDPLERVFVHEVSTEALPPTYDTVSQPALPEEGKKGSA